MKRNTNFDNSPSEVKKIKAKIPTTSLVAIAIAVLLLIISTVITADAVEPTQIIQGSIDGTSVSIMHDGITNIIILEKDGFTSEHYDGVIKTYNSGGFVIKNIESGIVLFAHPIGNEQYRLVVITNDMVYRLIGVSEIISESDAIVAPSSSLYDEPISSVGADIANWDIPTDGRDSDEATSLILTITGQTIPDMFRLGDDFEWNGYVYNARQGSSAKMVNIPVTLEISRDTVVLRSYTQDTNSAGQVRFLIDEIDYPEFYPEYCYDMKIMANYNGTNFIVEDDFVMQYTLGTKIWEPNTSWMGLNQWNHLPTDYKQEPRPRVNSDANCNE